MAEEAVETTGADVTAAPDTPAVASDFALTDEVMSSDYDEVEIPAQAGESAPEGADKAAQPAPAATPAVEAAKPPTPEAPKAAAVAAEAPKGAAAPTQAQPADLSSMPPDTLAGELARNRDAIIDSIAQQRFQLTQQERESLELDAPAALPRIMARVYFEAATTALNQIASHVPRLVESVSNSLRTVNEAEDSFYKAYPVISRTDPAHARAVNMAANLFRQQNPQASRDEAITAVGRMVTGMLNLQVAAAAPSNGRGNGTGRRPPAFSPASGNARTVSASVVTPPSVNPFEGMGADFDE